MGQIEYYSILPFPHLSNKDRSIAQSPIEHHHDLIPPPSAIDKTSTSIDNPKPDRTSSRSNLATISDLQNNDLGLL
jgi:hypothetical protein